MLGSGLQAAVTASQAHVHRALSKKETDGTRWQMEQLCREQARRQARRAASDRESSWGPAAPGSGDPIEAQLGGPTQSRPGHASAECVQGASSTDGEPLRTVWQSPGEEWQEAPARPSVGGLATLAAARQTP